jgi:hypothetical protein
LLNIPQTYKEQTNKNPINKILWLSIGLFRAARVHEQFFSYLAVVTITGCKFRPMLKACVTNQPIPSPDRLRCTYGVFLGIFGGWPYGATTATVLQQFLFSRRRGAVQGTGKF